MNLPKHINLTIEHQPHAANYLTVEQWLAERVLSHTVDISDNDRAAMIAAGEVWVVHWYPDTQVSFHSVGAATLERALELANAP